MKTYTELEVKGIDCHARDVLGRMFQDAIVHRFYLTSLFAAKEEDKEAFRIHKERNDATIEAYERIRDSYKLVAIEEVND
jgi:hypothetical protein